ncbi:hypothetical protein A6P54_13040 [Bacillus sp. MKU004]|nr:hypothetical protein A6P54_13040 [Bacillus sp. MKU004]
MEGYVKATSEAGVTGSVGFTLEVYQMKGDDKWYIGEHWGVLANINGTEKPVVENEGKDRSKHLGSSNPMGDGALDKETEEATEIDETDLIGAWKWSDSDEFYMIFRDDGTYSYIEKSAGFISEGTYTIEGSGSKLNVKVTYTTGERDSVMVIDLKDGSHLAGSENGYSWEAVRVNLDETERTLNCLRE